MGNGWGGGSGGSVSAELVAMHAPVENSLSLSLSALSDTRRRAICRRSPVFTPVRDVHSHLGSTSASENRSRCRIRPLKLPTRGMRAPAVAASRTATRARTGGREATSVGPRGGADEASSSLSQEVVDMAFTDERWAA